MTLADFGFTIKLGGVRSCATSISGMTEREAVHVTEPATFSARQVKSPASSYFAFAIINVERLASEVTRNSGLDWNEREIELLICDRKVSCRQICSRFGLNYITEV